MEEVKIGARIKELRAAQKMTLRALAEATGITCSMLSQIERDQVNPSINTLKLISRALGTPLWLFFRAGPSRDAVVRAGGRKSIGLPNNEEVRYELLTADTSGAIEFCEMILPGKSASGQTMQDHAGEETAYVLQGPVVLRLDGAEYVLDTADSVRIPSLTPHCWVNSWQQAARVIFAVTPPDF